VLGRGNRRRERPRLVRRGACREHARGAGRRHAGHWLAGHGHARAGRQAHGGGNTDACGGRTLGVANRAAGPGPFPGPGGERPAKRDRDGHTGAGSDRQPDALGFVRAGAGGEPAAGQAGAGDALFLPRACADAGGRAGSGADQGHQDAGGEPGARSLGQ